MALTAKELSTYTIMEHWHSQGAEIHIGGPEIGALTVQDTLNEFQRNHQNSYSAELVHKAVDELGAHDSRLGLQETQAMLLSQERQPAGIYRTLMARDDRAQAEMGDDLPGPSPS